MVEDLQERLGGGWVVDTMMHDSDRHPCELVETLAGVDVLLTPHGFQVSESQNKHEKSNPKALTITTTVVVTAFCVVPGTLYIMPVKIS